MRFAMWVGLLAAGVMGLGCQSSSRAPAPPRSPTANVPIPNRPFWDQPDNNRRSPTLSQPAADARTNSDGTRLTSGDQPDVNGILAGVVVDAYGQKPARAYIQIELAGAKSNGRPIDVAADESGYFMIPGLIAGRSYMLTARSDETGRLLVGRMQATVPNSRLYIRLREDMATGDVPPLPPHPGDLVPGNARNASGQNRGTSTNPAQPPLLDSGNTAPRSQHDGGWTPGGAGTTNGMPIAPPARDATNIPPPAAPIPNFENVAERDRDRGPAPPPPPLINLPSNGSGNQTDPDPPPSGGSGAGRTGSSFLPRTGNLAVCEISGQRITRLSTNELDGGTWDFEARHGELVLLDFWGSWCQPCLRAMPHLVDLQRRYGAYGLEVVGIACETERGEERDRNLRQIKQKLSVNYPILLADDRAHCPVQQRFGISAYPTLILVDRNGFILTRADGANFAQIDAIIQQRLGRR